MSVLALDLATSCGWCLWRRGDRIESGVWNLAEAGPDDADRFASLRQRLTKARKMLESAGETLNDIVYESVDFIPKKNGVYAAHVYGALWGNLLTWSRLHDIKPIGIPVATIKKHVTGHGSAAKPLVTMRIQELFPHVRKHDEADAVAVMLTAQNKFPRTPGSPHA